MKGTKGINNLLSVLTCLLPLPMSTLTCTTHLPITHPRGQHSMVVAELKDPLHCAFRHRHRHRRVLVTAPHDAMYTAMHRP